MTDLDSLPQYVKDVMIDVANKYGVNWRHLHPGNFQQASPPDETKLSRLRRSYEHHAARLAKSEARRRSSRVKAEVG